MCLVLVEILGITEIVVQKKTMSIQKKTIKNLLLSVYIANKSIKLVEIFGTI